MHERSGMAQLPHKLTALLVALVFLAAGVPAGAQQTPPPTVGGYILGSGDLLEVSVWGYADLTRTVAVRPDGQITVPLVGTVTAAGVSVEELTRVLTRAYRAFIKNPQVTVIVKEFRSIRISVLGQVAKPGSYSLPPGSRVLEAISAAGGILNSALVKEVRVMRSNKQTVTLQTDGLLRADVRHNPQLFGGETIYVPEVNKLSVSIVGQVHRPGSYELLPGTRLLDLLSAAGGVTDVAALREAQLLRPGEQPAVVDLEKVLAGDADANVTLRGGETLVVREDLLNVVNVMGEVVRPGRYRLKGEMRLVDVLLLAGGLTDRASVAQARLVRSRESQTLNLESLLLRQDMNHNIVMQPGDSVFVPEETNNRFYVLGDVSRPGVFATKGGLTVLQAIAMAGGPVQRGASTAKTAHIIRRTGAPEPAVTASLVGVKVEPLPNGASMTTVDLRALVQTGDTRRDVPIQPGDVLVVPQTTLAGMGGILSILSGVFWFFR